ncbi:MAG: hypothetical protein U9R34_06165 [Nanoarchaeota archaeon]|nr:hypothetical protein [Nanoarchaeota archaeon]
MNKKLIEGIPFTLDSKEMVKKSISNLSLDPDQYLKEIIGFALANNTSRIDIIDEKDMTEVNFDGPGIASKDDLKSLLMNIYNSDKDEGINNLGMLGRFVVASLKTKPLEIIIKTHDSHSNYIMKIDSKFDQKLFTIGKSSAKNSFAVIRRKKTNIKPLEIMINSYNYAKKTSVSDSLTDIFNKSLYCASEICKDTISNLENFVNNYNKKSGFKSNLKNRVKTLCSFSETPVYLNKKKINNGFTFPDSIYEREYKFDNIRILVSFSRRNHIKDFKRTVYIKNNLFICEYESNRNESDDFSSYLLSMDKAVDAPGIQMTLSGESLIEDEYFNSLEKKISKARNMFYEDILKNISKIEPHGKDELRNFITAFLYHNHSWRNNEMIKDIKLFSDIDGNEYTISEVSDVIKKQDNKLYYTKSKINKSHPLIKDKKEIIFSVASYTEAELFKRLFEFNSKITNFAKTVEKYEYEKKRKKKESQKKTINSIGKTTGVITSSSALLAGSYFGTIFISPYAVEYWHYAPITAACTGVAYVGIRGSVALGKQILNKSPKAWGYTSQRIEKIESIIKHSSWVNKTFKFCRTPCKNFYENSVNMLEVKIDKIQENNRSKQIYKIEEAKKKPITKIEIMMQKYIHALEKLIVSNGENHELGSYFDKIIKVETKEKSILSPLFSLEKYNDRMSELYKLIINTKRKSFSEKSGLYNHYSASIYYDLFEIGNMLENKLDYYNSRNLEKHILDAVHLSYLKDVVCSFSKGEESFKKDFSLLSKTERKGIIKEILCDGITTDNGIEE